jgi:N-acetylmuramoyl-L-alanine amidase
MRLVGDAAWAIMTIWQEARGESQAGKVAVAEVIRNRTEKLYTSDGTVAGTVLRKLQFSGWNTNDPNRTPSALLDDADPMVVACREAWITALAGSDTTLGSVLYCNLAIVRPPWLAGCRETAVIGHHTFFVPRHWG